LWPPICMANREVLFDELGFYIQELESLHAALADADAEKLEEVFSEARKVRSAWTQQ